MRAFWFGVFAGLGAVGCGSGGGVGSGPSEGGNAGVHDATTLGDGNVLDSNPPDGGSARDATAWDASSPYGDRNLGVSEPYPASVLMQNGGRFYDVMAPPTASQHAAKGDGTTDDTPAIQDAFDYLKAAYVAANPTGSPTDGFDGSNYWV